VSLHGQVLRDGAAGVNLKGREFGENGPMRIPLFSGGSLDGWQSRHGGPAPWQGQEDWFQVAPGTGDIHTQARFTDFQLHLEFWLPHMPWAQGQQRANSGVYLQGRYELQLLDSSAATQPKDDDCGALYKLAAPLRNACRPPEQWQALEVAFRAPRLEGGAVSEPGCLTVFLNGVLIHHHLRLTRPTPGGLEQPLSDPGPLLLQDHGDPVRFRNVWALPF